MTISGKDIRKLAKASALSHSDDPKDQDRARARKTDVDYKDLVRQLKAKRKKLKEENELEESPSIRKVRGKRNTSLVATGDHRRDKEGNIKASFYKKKPAPQGEKSGERIPVLTRKGKRNKSAMYGSQLHRLRPASERLGKKKVKEDWKPEIEHSKLGDAVKKKAEKKRKEAESSLPPHLKLDAMKKAFAHTNESFTIDKSAHKSAQKKAKLRNLAKGNTNPNEKAAAEKKAGGPKLIGEKLGSWKQAIKSRDKAAKSIKTGKSPSHKARRRKRSKPGGTEKLSDVNKAGESKSMQSVGGFRGAHGASRKSKSAQGRAARIEYRRKSPAAAPKKHDTESVKKIGTFVGLQKRIKESASIRKIRGKRNASLVATGDHRRDKEGNIEADFYKKKPAPTGDKWKKTGYKKPKRDLVAMRARKKAKREKREARAREIAALPLSKSARATTVKEDFKRFMADAQAARERVKKKQEERKKKDAQFTDTKKHGIKFYDKKGSGRIVKGKKVYN